MRRRAALTAMAALLVVVVPAARADAPPDDAGQRAIAFVGAYHDRPDLVALGLGRAGSWFPQFAATAAVTGAPTGDNVRDTLPAWVAAFNHTTGPADPGCTEPRAVERGCTPTYAFRTFSQDGPARSAGGQPGWSRLRLPSGECGRSGAIVDPQTYVAAEPNVNNTVNRIQLQGDVPDSFYVSVVTDNTGRQHDPDRLELRGNAGQLDVPSEVTDNQVEATFDEPMDLTADGVPDVYVFRVDGFVAGDYLKLRLRGVASAASFAGLLFDDHEPIAAGAGRDRRCR